MIETKKVAGPGKKLVPVTVSFFLYQEVPEDWDDGAVRFYVEEQTCLDNWVNELADDQEDGACSTCMLGSAVVGHPPER